MDMLTADLPTRLPTRRDEAWRYADIDAVARLGVAALDQWTEIALAPGEVWRQAVVVGSAAPELHRIRLRLDGAEPLGHDHDLVGHGCGRRGLGQ